MKVLLPMQIEEAERQRDALAQLMAEGVVFNEGPAIEHRLNCQEAIVLSLRFLQTYEQPFRRTYRQIQSENQATEGQ